MASPAQQWRHVGRLGKWLPWIMVAAVVVALVVALLVVRVRMSSAGTSSKWQTYRDPFGLYTLQLPPGWVAQVTTSSVSYGDSSGSATTQIEMVTFDEPSQGTGSAHLYTIAWRIKTTFDHQFYCGPSTLRQGFSPMTLNTFGQSGVSLFVTEDAYFQINVTIPNDLVQEPDVLIPPPTPTAVPISWSATDQTVVNQMLVSFQPTDPKPLAC